MTKKVNFVYGSFIKFPNFKKIHGLRLNYIILCFFKEETNQIHDFVQIAPVCYLDFGNTPRGKFPFSGGPPLVGPPLEPGLFVCLLFACLLSVDI